MIGVTQKDYQWAARIYKQKAVVKQMEDDIKTMVYTLLGGERKLEVLKCDKPEGYDTYCYCKNPEKTYCPSKNKRWHGYITELGYGFWSDSELGVYLQVLESLIGNQTIYPAVK